jgi:hypothetical protein
MMRGTVLGPALVLTLAHPGSWLGARSYELALHYRAQRFEGHATRKGRFEPNPCYGS